MRERRKTDPNHKARFRLMVQCVCSCGWQSAPWIGKGAKTNASAEWHGHRDKCDAAKKEAA